MAAGDHKDNTEMLKLLLQNNQAHIEKQLEQLSENSKKMSDHIQEMRIEITKLNSLVNNDLETLNSQLAENSLWIKNHDQIITLDDLKKLKEEVQTLKKFQLQTLTIGGLIMVLLQGFIIPFLTK